MSPVGWFSNTRKHKKIPAPAFAQKKRTEIAAFPLFTSAIKTEKWPRSFFFARWIKGRNHEEQLISQTCKEFGNCTHGISILKLAPKDGWRKFCTRTVFLDGYFGTDQSIFFPLKWLNPGPPAPDKGLFSNSTDRRRATWLAINLGSSRVEWSR